MFGIIASGRLVQTEFQQIEQTKFITTIVDADNINHIVVFLTGVMPFPEGAAGMVYWSWPDPNAPPNWQLLGYISNDKPSVIFKVSNFKKLHEMDVGSNIAPFGQQAICHNAQIGISLEPIVNIQNAQPVENANTYATFAQKMLDNFTNYILSYGVTQQQMVPDPNTTYVPLPAIQNWFTNFQRRLANNPNFWKT
nr:protein OPI10 homolog [Onthophagus taurus]